MKYSLSVILAIVFLLSVSNRNNEETIYRFVFENESGVNIRLAKFGSGSNSFVKNIDIPNSDFVIKDFQSSDMGEVYGIQNFFQGDSINVIYWNNLKINSYICES